MARAKRIEPPAKLNLRMPESLQAKVERDADKRGLSMNAVIISRLEASFRHDRQLSEALADALGGPRTAAVLRTLAGLAQVESAALGSGEERWLDEYASFNAVTDRWQRALKDLTPAMPDLMRQWIERVRAIAKAIDNPDIEPSERQVSLIVTEISAGDTRLPQEVRAEFAAVVETARAAKKG